MEENQEETIENVRPKVAMIVAMGKNQEIGSNNDLMWHLREDMMFFKETTMGYFVVMGRKNFESIPDKYRPLNGRVNVIISRNPDFMYEECYTCQSIDEAIDIARANGEEKVFVIGGGQIYKMAMEQGIVDEMYITRVNAEFPHADVFFPQIIEEQWDKSLLKEIKADIQNEFDCSIYHYTKKNG